MAMSGPTLLTHVVAAERKSKRRVVVVAMPEMGHASPVVNVACELARRGHEVRFASCAFLEGKVSKLLQSTGVEFLPLARDVESADTPGSETFRLKQLGSITLYLHYNAKMKPDLIKCVEDLRPDVILADFMTLCALEAGDACGVPVAVNFADTCLFNLLGTSPSRPAAHLLGAAGTLLGGEPWSNGLEIADFTWRVVESLYSRLCLVNSAFGMQEASPMPPNIVLTGPTGPRLAGPLSETSCPELNRWLAEVRRQKLRIVYVTFGSMVRLSAEQVRCIFTALVELPGVAVAWSLKEEAQAYLPPNRPGHLFVHSWFPQAEFLQVPEVRAVVTHCGWGGLMEIVLAGKPIVGVPFFGDQGFNASLAKQRGLGEVLQPGSLTPARLREKVCRLLDGAGYAASAGRLQASMAASGGATLCAEQVEDLAAHGGNHLVRQRGCCLLSSVLGVGQGHRAVD